VKTLQAAGSEAAVFSDTAPDPTVASLSGGLDLVEGHDADGIIGFGGGSPMDTAKALAVLSANGGSGFSVPARSGRARCGSSAWAWARGDWPDCSPPR
jgi:alcohol dehydrogenase class IV